MDLAATIRLARAALEEFANRHQYNPTRDGQALSEVETAIRMQYDYFENAIRAIEDAEFARTLDEGAEAGEGLATDLTVDWQGEELRALLAFLNNSGERPFGGGLPASTGNAVDHETIGADDFPISVFGSPILPITRGQPSPNLPFMLTRAASPDSGPLLSSQQDGVQKGKQTIFFTEEYMEDTMPGPSKSATINPMENWFENDSEYHYSEVSISRGSSASSLNSGSSAPSVQMLTTPPSKNESTVPYEQCAACLNFVSGNEKKLQAPCGDFYCENCIVGFVEACTRDESVFPLRCCNRAMPHISILPFLPPHLDSYLRSKRVELAVPPNYRLYCPSSVCAVFLGSSEEAKGEMVCYKCDTSVCVSCKQLAHPEESCRDNAAILEVRALAHAQKWQTCPDCNAIVELLQGCYHMTCRCRAQFCYLCALRWKECGCPLWDEGLIIMEE